MGLEIQLDPDLMAGQMVVAGFEGKTLPAEIEKALARGHLSGVILFNRNLGTPEEVRGLTDAIRSAASLPPIIAIDQEGGRVQRLSAPFTRWPSMRALGKKDSRAARNLAAAIAAELLAVGVNTNLAPVLDVDSNPGCSAIADRSLGPDPNTVAHLGAAMIMVYREAGLISCAKHFPGLGDVAVDSHDDLPVSKADRETLDRRELIPFSEAVTARVPMIMAGHLKVTALDPYYPATISRPILNDLLREIMGFDGVIITDDLMMGALMKYMPLKDAAFSAVRAGADLLLTCSGPASAEETRRTIVDGLHQGALEFGQITLSVRRVIKMKEDYLLKKLPPRAEIKEVVGSGKHKELAERLG